MRWINGTRLDDRIIRSDWDCGFIGKSFNQIEVPNNSGRIMITFSKTDYQQFILEGRQYGRGKTGGQVRDEYRTDYDPGRGGYGKRNEDASNRKR